MISNTLLNGFFGGLLIGLSASIYLLVNGKIMGVSGILSGVFGRQDKKIKIERMAFVVGLILTPFLIGFFMQLPDTNATSSISLLIVAGLLVGFGTRLGSGCTSGHGICGMSRLSMRSIMATIVFMGFGVFTVFLFRFITQ